MLLKMHIDAETLQFDHKSKALLFDAFQITRGGLDPIPGASMTIFGKTYLIRFGDTMTDNYEGRTVFMLHTIIP